MTKRINNLDVGIVIETDLYILFLKKNLSRTEPLPTGSCRYRFRQEYAGRKRSRLQRSTTLTLPGELTVLAAERIRPEMEITEMRAASNT